MSVDEHRFTDLVEAVRRFRDEREWAPFHNPKDLAVSVAVEAAELLEHFQWKDERAVREALADAEERRAVAHEMADVLLLLVSLSDALEMDLLEAAFEKLAVNAERYPVEKARGRADKYDRL